MNYEDFIKRIKDPDDLFLIKKAYEFANKYLGTHVRRNGQTQVSHALEVANILIDLNVDNITIASAILHEIADYSEEGELLLEKTFGSEITKIVLSVSKINHLEMVDNSDDGAIYLRKVMVGLSEDVRVLFIKLADRLHNMRTMDVLSEKHQKKVASETLNVLVPIAHRLGINYLKSELENLCLYYLKPDVYNDILEKLNNTTNELNSYLLTMKESISQILTLNDVNFEIKGRVKSVYSIYNKLSNGKKWDDIYDILAMRIFVEKESECYQVVGLIHSKYKPIDGRFKDYIAVPKENMYQSLHTTVLGEGGRHYEIQIRTYEMDEIAEKGIASHWSYKEKGSKKIQVMMEQKLERYRAIIENNEDESDLEFENVIDNNILSDLIYVFTPKGDVVELPKGSTPVDFAYRIHSKVGDTMVGAIVNDKMVPINTPLNENDVVKIMTNPTSKPNKDWLDFVYTTQARNKIKAYFSKIDRDLYITKGKDILDKEARKRKVSIGEITSNASVLCDKLKLKDIDDLYLSVGTYRYTPSYIINIVTGESEESDVLITKRVKNTQNNRNSDIFVDGKSSILTHLAKCCNPVMGDEITGVITKFDGIAVHRKECINTINANIVDVSWNEAHPNTYIAQFYVYANEAKDATNDIVSSITNIEISIAYLELKNKGIYELKVRVKNLEDIKKIINALSKLRYVKKVERI